MAGLSVSNLRKTYDEKHDVLKGLTFDVPQAGFFTVLGPTNAGKSTLLKIIAGVENASDGEISLGSRRIERLEPRQRGLSLLFQNIALFPNKSGYENIAFPLRKAGWAQAAVDNRVKEVASLLKVDHVLARLPRTFSGGEQQRIAIGRAIALPTELLMLDEPLTNLDARMRIALRLEFKRLHRETNQTILYVTHDHAEALSLSDRIAVLNSGRFEQIGTPEQIYNRPTTEFVARFVGSPPMNIIDVELENRGSDLYVRGHGFAARISGYDGSLKLPRNMSVGVRAEEIVASVDASPASAFPGEIEAVEELGSYRILDVLIGKQRLKVRLRTDHKLRNTGRGWFGFTVPIERLLDRETGFFVRPGISGVSDRDIIWEESKCA